MNMIGFVSGRTYFDTSQTLGKTSTSRTGYVYFMLIVVCVFYDKSFAAAAQIACPRRLLGHRGAWLEEGFPSMNEGNEITIKRI
jgi:hypothetical protein